MPIISRNNDVVAREPLPLGNQHAVCAFVEDIGTQEGSYMGTPLTHKKVVVCWELKEKMTIDQNTGKPFMTSKSYTNSLGAKANLRKDLESWRGKAFTKDELNGFDLEVLIGVNCLLNIISYEKGDGSEGRKIGSISPAIKGMERLEVIKEHPPAWIQKEREKSLECQNGDDEQPYDQSPPIGEDDLPF